MFTNASPHRGVGIIFDDPAVFDMSRSKGSEPLVVCTTLQPQTAADVPDIKLIRLMTSRGYHHRVDVNLFPFEEGQLAAEAGKGTKACPYTEFDPEYDEWMEGYES